MPQKLQFTLFFLIGFVFFWYLAPIGISIFKKRLTKVNPGLVEKAPWYFTIVHFLARFMAVMCLLIIIMVWLSILKL